MKPCHIFYCFLLTILPFYSFAQWVSVGTGINDTQLQVNSLAVVDENIVWAVASHFDDPAGYHFTRTLDGGITWHPGQLPNVGDYRVLNIFALSDSIAWVIMNTNKKSKIFKTIDGGTMWEEQFGGFNEEDQHVYTLHFFNELEGIAFGGYGLISEGNIMKIFRTDNGGQNWDLIAPELLPPPMLHEEVFLYSGNNAYESKGDTLWFVTERSRIFRTTDRGQTWSAVNVPVWAEVHPAGYSTIAFENSQRGLCFTFEPGYAKQTNDGGETWEWQLSDDLPLTNIAAVEHIPGTENTYLALSGFQWTPFSSRMNYTTDGGSSWNSFFPEPWFLCHQFISPTVGFAGGPVISSTEGGIYKWTGNWLDSTSVKIPEPQIPEPFNIYPNPTSGELIVKGDMIDETTLVEIYNTKGIKLESIEISPGTNSGLDINLGSISSGVYFIKFTDISGNVFMKKITKY